MIRITNHRKIVDPNNFKIDHDHPLGHGKYGNLYLATSPDYYFPIVVKEYSYENSTPTAQSALHEDNIFFTTATYHQAVLEIVGVTYPVLKKGVSFMIISPYCKCKSLGYILSQELKGISVDIWDDTHRSMCVFGVACGLCYLHYYHLRHRNIRPSSVVFSDSYEPKLTDFGYRMATRINEIPLEQDPKRYYTPPEVMKDPKRLLSKKADIYSFGMLLYEICTGYSPFECPEEVNKEPSFKQIREKKLRPMLPNSIPSGYRDIILRCWSKSTKRRPKIAEIVKEMNDNNYKFPDTDIHQLESYRKRALNGLVIG